MDVARARLVCYREVRYSSYFLFRAHTNTHRIRNTAPCAFKTCASLSSSIAGSRKLLAMQANASRFTGGPLQEGKALKLATFLNGEGHSAVGLIVDETIWPLKDAVDLPADFGLENIRDMIGVIRHWDMIKNRIVLRGEGTLLTAVKVLAPLPRPTGVIMCIGKNYVDHVKEIDSWKVAPGIAAPDVPKVKMCNSIDLKVHRVIA